MNFGTWPFQTGENWVRNLNYPNCSILDNLDTLVFESDLGPTSARIAWTAEEFRADGRENRARSIGFHWLIEFSNWMKSYSENERMFRNSRQSSETSAEQEQSG